jgi:hypothetical protein
MALHLRDQIMDALATLLAGLTTTGHRVFVDRDLDAEPLQASELPAISLMQADDSTEPLTLAFPRTMDAVLDVDVVAHVKAATGTAARLLANLIAKEVAAALGAQPLVASLGAVITQSQSPPEWDGASELPAGRLTLRYRVRYQFNESTPDVPG